METDPNVIHINESKAIKQRPADLPGQFTSLHTTDSNVSPLQSCPPFAGAGLSQARVLVELPPGIPQLCEQLLQDVQVLQLPSVTKMTRVRCDRKGNSYECFHVYSRTSMARTPLKP